MKIGDKLKCKNDINNLFECPLFIKDNIYEVLHIDGNLITLNHILYANEFADFEEEYVLKNFYIIN